MAAALPRWTAAVQRGNAADTIYIILLYYYYIYIYNIYIYIYIYNIYNTIIYYNIIFDYICIHYAII